MSIRVTVRNTAIGSLLPDSISRVAVTRSFRPLPPSSEHRRGVCGADDRADQQSLE